MFAQFETDVGRERQSEGIARAKKAGMYSGGKPRIDIGRLQALIGEGLGPAAVAKALGVSQMSVYRILRESARFGHLGAKA